MRTLLIGDVHGCADELGDLLDHAKYQAGDALVFVGDIIARGPHSKRTLRMVKGENGRVTRGNHEGRLLAWRAEGSEPGDLSEEHARVEAVLDEEDWSFMEGMPLWIDLPAHELRVLHGGLERNRPIEEQSERALLTLRHVLDDQGNKVLWGAAYEGPPHVVFGHHAMAGLQLHPWATGLDTGCVYGGRLTALVLDAGEPVALAERQRRAQLVSVPARAVYFVPKARG